MFLHVASHNVQVDILALQETWRLPFTETIQITGYQFIHQHRSANRGGGVGFYIKDNITFKHLPELSVFADNIFESLTIEVKIHKKNLSPIISI